MLRRHLGLVRAWSAAGLFGAILLTSASRADEPTAPVPGDETNVQTVQILDAREDGSIDLKLQGHGADKVRVVMRNITKKRLRVVLPPGLVASSATAQPGGGLGGGFQSMGLGVPTTRAGSFGRFPGAGAGFHSVPLEDGTPATGIVIAPGATADFSIPGVCLNFGIDTPTARDRFQLMTVEDYTPDPRARKALKSLATLGTSQHVAQAVAWNVFNGMTFDQLAAQSVKRLNLSELGLAARFVQALDVSGSSEILEMSYLNQGRILVHLEGEGPAAKDAYRLAAELDGQQILGLPVRVVDAIPSPESHPSAMLLLVQFANTPKGTTAGRVLVRHNPLGDAWLSLGRPSFKSDEKTSELDAAKLGSVIDSTLASTFVSMRVVRRNPGSTVVRIDNRLPFSIAHATIRTGREVNVGHVLLDGLGTAPGGSTTANIPAPLGTVESVTLNGL
jgi:hypothetical protein